MTRILGRISRYSLPRFKLAYGHISARLADFTFLRPDPQLQLVRIGTAYGGRYCCRALFKAGETAICCGAGQDVVFDVALNAVWGMRIICVDPTPRAITHVSALLDAHRDGRSMLIEAGPLGYELAGFRAQDFTFIPHAVWSSDGSLELFAPKDPAHVSYSAVNLQHTSETIRVPASSIATILQESNASRLTLLKLDIEGAEHEVLRSMLAANIFPDQLLVEFDQINQPLTPLFWVYLLRTYRELRAAGYRLVHREGANCALRYCVPRRIGHEMSKLLLVEQYFYPEGWGGAQIPRDIAIGLRQAGFEVQVLCSKDQYAPMTNRSADPTSFGIRIRRVPRVIPGPVHRLKALRIIWFCLYALPCLLFSRAVDLFVTQTNPPLIVPTVALASALRRKPFVIIAQDLYPEALFAASHCAPGSWFGRCLQRLFSWSYRRATRVVALGGFMRGRILRRA